MAEAEEERLRRLKKTEAAMLSIWDGFELAFFGIVLVIAVVSIAAWLMG